MTDLLLYNLFEQTRERYNRHLGLADYMLLLEALERGYGIGNKDELQDLCCLLWLKTKPQQEQFKGFFIQFLKQEQKDWETNTEVLPPVEDTKPLAEGGVNKDDNINNPSNNDALQPKTTSENTGTQTTQGGTDTSSVDGSETVKMQWVLNKLIANKGETLNTEGVDKTPWKLSNEYILSDNYHPFTERQLRQQWRRLRRKKHVGYLSEMDIDATVLDIATKGFFNMPFAKKRMANVFRLVILVDWKGSMLAFHTLSRLVIDTLKQELPETEVWFFRNQPQEYFYGQTDWTKDIKTEKLVKQLQQQPASILIISDGGAARGTYVTERLQAWWRFLNKLKPTAPNILWLNPMPQDRWAGTTAGYVGKIVPMKELKEDVKGIKDMVKLMKT
jgi:uncharacterized protein